MMNALRHMQRFLAVFMVAIWGVAGVVAPVHAAEEDLHHAIQHDGADDMTSADPLQGDKDTIHPKHTAHCSPGGCHCHVVSRAIIDTTCVLVAAGELFAPAKDVVPQTYLSSLFRPPRI